MRVTKMNLDTDNKNKGKNVMIEEQILRGQEEGVDVSIYNKSCFNWVQMKEIRWGLMQGLDVSVYAKPEYSAEQMEEIRLGLSSPDFVRLYANSAFTWRQMHEIRLGCEHGINDVELYAKPEISADEMERIRKRFEDEEGCNIFKHHL